MAALTFSRSAGTNANLIPQKWAQKYLKDMHAKDPLAPFWGGNMQVVTTDYDLKAGPGDKVTIPIVGLPGGAGVTDDGDYDTNADDMTLYNMNIVVHEHGRAKKINGQMTEKSSMLKLRPLLMDQLTQWAGMFRARSVIDALSGLAQHNLGGNVLGASGLTGHSNVTKVAPTPSATANRYFAGGVTAAGVLSRVADVTTLSATNHRFGTGVIEHVKRMATRTVDSSGNLIDPIQPVNVNGKPLYLMLVTPQQGRDLKADTNWRAGHQYADIRGLENSIFSGQLGVWDGVMIIETDLLHKRYGKNGITSVEYFEATSTAVASGVNAHRALFCGQSAAAWAWGKAPSYKEFWADNAETKKGCLVTSIYGVMKVCKFSTAATPVVVADSERGCIVVDTATSIATQE